MSEERKYHFETLQLHVGQEQADPATDARAVPIYQTTSFVFHNAQHAADRFALKDAGNVYGRLTNPTEDVFSKRIAAREGGVAAVSVASGAAAVTYALEALVHHGQHIVAATTIYGGTYNLFEHTFPNYGIETTFVDPTKGVEVFEEAIKENTRVVYIESIGNPNAKKTLLVVSNLHAREYMTAQLCMAQIESYLKNYNGSVKGVKVINVLNKMAIHYIPMANPDGTTISQFGISKIRDRKLRKALYKMSGASHTATWKANARGVDLNRNSNSHFKANHGGKRGSEGFSGPSAASEPETKAIAGLLKQLKNNKTLKGVVNYHAMGSIVFGSGGSGKVKKETQKMYRLARKITGYASGDSYGSSSGPSVGSMRDYVMEKIKSPCITLEIGVAGCPLPISQFSSIWRKNESLVLREAKLLL